VIEAWRLSEERKGEKEGGRGSDDEYEMEFGGIEGLEGRMLDGHEV
jgi:hypothetical protein